MAKDCEYSAITPVSGVQAKRALFWSLNTQTQLFKLQKAAAIIAWNAEPEELKHNWEITFNAWYTKNYRGINKMKTPYMWYVSNFVNRN
ncbi:MAG: hypothetical protein RAO94_05815 [Candidatus Stygibacter australis]|nr:hypothetical protein [Candidatus Stygibacter australis]MDP8321847.1 hypothetical protein [Candidatus Stygibacter australis]